MGGGGYNWYVKMPQCAYMEHGLKSIAFYVQKHIVPRVVYYYFPLVRDKPLGAPKFVRPLSQLNIPNPLMISK